MNLSVILCREEEIPGKKLDKESGPAMEWLIDRMLHTFPGINPWLWDFKLEYHGLSNGKMHVSIRKAFGNEF